MFASRFPDFAIKILFQMTNRHLIVKKNHWFSLQQWNQLMFYLPSNQQCYIHLECGICPCVITVIRKLVTVATTAWPPKLYFSNEFCLFLFFHGIVNFHNVNSWYSNSWLSCKCIKHCCLCCSNSWLSCKCIKHCCLCCYNSWLSCKCIKHCCLCCSVFAVLNSLPESYGYSSGLTYSVSIVNEVYVHEVVYHSLQQVSSLRSIVSRVLIGNNDQ